MSLNGESCEVCMKIDGSDRGSNIKKLISRNIWYFAIKNYSKSKHLEQKDGIQSISAFRERKSLNYLEVQNLVIQRQLLDSDYFELNLDKEVFDYLNFENIILMNEQNSLRVNKFFDFEIIEDENPEYYI
jgi:hypothetical protein